MQNKISFVIPYCFKVYTDIANAAGPALFRLHPQEGLTIFQLNMPSKAGKESFFGYSYQVIRDLENLG